MSDRSADYDARRFPGVPIPADWVCAFVACGQRADQPHLEGCPYGVHTATPLPRRAEGCACGDPRPHGPHDAPIPPGSGVDQ